MTTRKSMFWALSLAGAIGGCGGPPASPYGPDITPVPPPSGASIVAVNPVKAYLGRHAVVQMGGSLTHFVQGVTAVRFDDANIQVEQVTVLGPTLLQVQIFVGPQDPSRPETYATVRGHGFSVSTGDETAGLTSFPIHSTLSAAGADPDGQQAKNMAQGGVGFFAIGNVESPDLPFSDLAQVNLLGEGLTLGSQRVLGNRILVRAAADVNAPLSAGLFINQGQSAPFHVLPAGVDGVSPRIEQRQPSDLSLSRSNAGKLPAANDSLLYKTTLPQGEQVLSFAFSPDRAGGPVPALALLPQSGKWKDQLTPRGAADPAGQTPLFTVVSGGQDLYGVVYDPAGRGGDDFSFSLTARQKAPVSPDVLVLSLDAGSPNTQVDLSKGPAYLKGLPSPTGDQKHYFQFIAPGDGKIYALTGLGAAAGHPGVEVLDGTCDAGKSLAHSAGTGYAALSFDGKALATYCAVMSRAANAADPPYSLLLTTDL